MSARVSWRKESDNYMKEHACDREMGVKGVNIKGIQIFQFKMMIHVIHTRTKIDLSNMHPHTNSHASMLFNM